jgi:valyl-tRNA synthetase
VKKMSERTYKISLKNLESVRRILRTDSTAPSNTTGPGYTAPYIPPVPHWELPTGEEWVKPLKPSKYDPSANDDNEAQRLINDLEQREKELKKKEKKLKKEQEDFKKEQEKLEAERKKIEEEKAVIEKERADLDERRNKIEDAEFKKSELGELIT